MLLINMVTSMKRIVSFDRDFEKESRRFEDNTFVYIDHFNCVTFIMVRDKLIPPSDINRKKYQKNLKT